MLPLQILFTICDNADKKWDNAAADPNALHML